VTCEIKYSFTKSADAVWKVQQATSTMENNYDVILKV